VIRLFSPTNLEEIMSSHSDSHDHHEEKPSGFLNTVFDESMGGFGIVWVSGLLIVVTLLIMLG